MFPSMIEHENILCEPRLGRRTLVTFVKVSDYVVLIMLSGTLIIVLMCNRHHITFIHVQSSLLQIFAMYNRHYYISRHV